MKKKKMKTIGLNKNKKMVQNTDSSLTNDCLPHRTLDLWCAVARLASKRRGAKDDYCKVSGKDSKIFQKALNNRHKIPTASNEQDSL